MKQGNNSFHLEEWDLLGQSVSFCYLMSVGLFHEYERKRTLSTLAGYEQVKEMYINHTKGLKPNWQQYKKEG